ncbi:MAG TPA: hypothetical protein VMT34_01070, partial [Aggregatilineales bacterium]|nr:hypothetical protein [Aggregatilineales bacterium]
STVVPLIRPMIGILGFSAIVLVVVMVLFSNSLVPVAVQTRVPDASVVTPAGSINLPFNGADGHPIVVSKTIFFVGLVLIVLVTLGIMGLLLALLMNWLSAEVKVAKTMPDSPPQHEPLLFRLIDFFLGWVGDMLETTRKSVLR